MESCSASVGSCATVRPPRSLMRLMPMAPSPSAPESTMAAQWAPWLSARVRKNRSTATCLPGRMRARSLSCKWPSAMDRCLPGGMTYTWLASTLVRPRTCWTGMVVARWSTSARMESCSGARCMMTTKAMPQSGAIAPKNAFKAASPPAEPPRPTTGSLEKPSVGTMLSIPAPFSCSITSGVSAGRPWFSGASGAAAGEEGSSGSVITRKGKKGGAVAVACQLTPRAERSKDRTCRREATRRSGRFVPPCSGQRVGQPSLRLCRGRW